MDRVVEMVKSDRTVKLASMGAQPAAPAPRPITRMDDGLMMHKELEDLREKHLQVDVKIKTLLEKPFQDQLRLMRLKREKLQLKDAIWQIEEALYPDLIA